jgi:hypothetical protein
MTVDLNDEQDREWAELYAKIQALLGQFWKEDDTELKDGSYVYERKDYLLVDDNWGGYQHKIETGNVEILKPTIVKSLQEILSAYPNWEIMITLGSSEKDGRPPMGVVIRDDEIIDGLRREYLPKEFQSFEYEGSRPLGSRFGDIMYTE